MSGPTINILSLIYISCSKTQIITNNIVVILLSVHVYMQKVILT